MHFTILAFIHTLLWIHSWASEETHTFDVFEDVYRRVPHSSTIQSSDTALRIPPPSTKAINTPVQWSNKAQRLSENLSRGVRNQLQSFASLRDTHIYQAQIQSTFFQSDANSDASILTLNVEHKSGSTPQRFLELSICQNHVSVMLRALSSANSNQDNLLEEILPYHFPLKAWHKVSLTLTARPRPGDSTTQPYVEHYLDLVVNCSTVYAAKPIMRPIDWAVWRSANVVLSVDLGRLEGYISETKLLFRQLSHSKKDGRAQLPSHCSPGENRLPLVNVVAGDSTTNPAESPLPPLTANDNVVSITPEQLAGLQTQLQQLTIKLVGLQEKVQKLEQCKCQAICRYGATTYDVGAMWNVSTSCQTCVCEAKGEVTCRPIQCAQPQCKNPVQPPGSCCRVCLRKCHFQSVEMEHGEILQKSCTRCECEDGSVRCQKIECPVLTCSSFHQVRPTPTSCCKECRVVNHCDKPEERCPLNSRCISLARSHTCACKAGYYPDRPQNATACTDIDECSTNHSIATNKIQPVNVVKKAPCEEPLICVNTPGSYQCICPPGYKEHNGTEKCIPICDIACANNGKCIAPNKCQCPNGFLGVACQLDINECALGVHQCHPYSECINIPGSYYCRCRQGFAPLPRLVGISPPGDFVSWTGAECSDINECNGELGVNFTCNPNRRCLNRPPGSYDCQCKYYSRCDRSCYVREGEGMVVYNHGQEYVFSNLCRKCLCKKGRFLCSPMSCKDCSQRWITQSCCPNCQRDNAGNMSTCSITSPLNANENEASSITMSIGSEWIYNCSQCKCTLDPHTGIPKVVCTPLSCPRVSCPNPRPLSKGHCCPICDSDPTSMCSSLPHSSSSSKLSLISSTDTISESFKNCSLPLSGSSDATLFTHGHQWVVQNLTLSTSVVCQCFNGRICCSQRHV